MMSRFQCVEVFGNAASDDSACDCGDLLHHAKLDARPQRMDSTPADGMIAASSAEKLDRKKAKLAQFSPVLIKE